MPIAVTKCDAALGAEIGVDLACPIDAVTFVEIEAAFHDNIVVFFRGQDLSDERHIEFSRRFGELEIHIVKKYLLPGHPEILLVSNIKNKADEHIGLADAGFTWHSDVSYPQFPPPDNPRAAARCFTRRRCRTATASRSATRSSPIAPPPTRRCRPR